MSGGNSTAAHAGPGRGRRHLASPRRARARLWFTVIAGAAAIAAGASAYALSNTTSWVLTAPATAASLGHDSNPVDQLSFASAVAKFRSSVTGLSAYRHLRSTVSAIYTLGSDQAVGFVGFNGSFGEQFTLKTTDRLAVTSVDPGPHGGAAECGHSSASTICDWSTGTTVGILLIAPANGSSRGESTTAAGKLMIKIRDAVERSAHGS
ncbi:MAG: hypothetical protein ACRDNF_04875 [Streptosporangiaceae bacterium]